MRPQVAGALAVGGLLVALFVAPSADAQFSTAAGDDVIDDDVIDEVIVTATRRSTRLQRTAASIGVLSGDDLESAGAFDVDDYWRMVPSVSFFDKGFGGKRVALRGINDTAINGTGAPIVASYFDDTPLIAQVALFQQAPSFNAVDIERVEVLRGPQGTLFGAGTMGGAIRTITRKADPSGFSQFYDAQLSQSAHGGTNYTATVAINAPLVKDRSAVRATAWLIDKSGFVDDISLGIGDKNRTRTVGIRVGGTWHANDKLTLRGKLQHQDGEADGFPWEDPVGKPGLGLATSADYQSALLVDDFRDENTTLASIDLDFRLNFGTLTSVTSWFETDTELLIDWANEGFFGFGIYLPFNIPVAQTQRAIAQELRITANDSSKLNWLVGAFYLDDSRDERNNRINAPGLNDICGGCSAQPDGEEFLFGSVGKATRTEAGLFADVVLPLTEKLEANAGLRWYDVEIGSDFTEFGGLVGDPPPSRTSQTFKFNGVTGKASIAYSPADHAMVYALVSSGFREGGTNGALLAQVCGVQEVYEPDEIWNYELGVRSQWLGRQLVLNATLYVIDWSDAQLKVVTAGCPGNAIVNSEGITSRGAEIEFAYKSDAPWELSGGIGITDSTLDNSVPLLNAPAGRRVPYTPDITASLSATVNPGRLGTLDTSLRLDIQHVGDSYSEITEFAGVLPIVKQSSYSIVNLRVGFTSGPWEWSIFADNLFDEKATLACCGVVGEITINRPRTIGLRAVFRD